MKIGDADILILPGLGGGRSSPDYWYLRWRERMATARVVEQENWDDPEPSDWIIGLNREIARCRRPIVLVAHSAGALVVATAFCDTTLKGNIAGAFLVAPADPVRGSVETPALRPFKPTPTGPLPFPSMLIASRDDPWCDWDAAAGMALDWGCELADAGNAGHIDAESGHGPWPEGMVMFARMMSRL